MSELKANGGPAYPRIHGREPSGSQGGTMDYCSQEGMTLRDYFAGQAASGMGADTDCQSWEEVAERAYKIADAMIKERDK